MAEGRRASPDRRHAVRLRCRWRGGTTPSDPPRRAQQRTGARPGETAWADGYVGRLVAAGVAALGFATKVVHTEVPARLVDTCRRRGLILVEVAERAPFMAIIAFVNDAAAREQRERLEWSLAAHRTIARAALRPDGLNAVLKELEGQLGCWVALFDAAGYRVPTTTRLPVPAAVEREVGEAVHTALSRGTRGSLRISGAGADVTMQTLGRSRRAARRAGRRHAGAPRWRRT